MSRQPLIFLPMRYCFNYTVWFKNLGCLCWPLGQRDYIRGWGYILDSSWARLLEPLTVALLWRIRARHLLMRILFDMHRFLCTSACVGWKRGQQWFCNLLMRTCVCVCVYRHAFFLFCWEQQLITTRTMLARWQQRYVGGVGCILLLLNHRLRNSFSLAPY